MRGIRKIRRSERKDGAEGEGRGRSRNNELQICTHTNGSLVQKHVWDTNEQLASTALYLSWEGGSNGFDA